MELGGLSKECQTRCKSLLPGTLILVAEGTSVALPGRRIRQQEALKVHFPAMAGLEHKPQVVIRSLLSQEPQSSR